MNNRKRNRAAARRKAEYGKRESMHRLLDAVLDINGTERRRRDITGDLPTVFLYFSGHTASVDIDIHRHGWVPDNHPEFNARANLNNVNSIIEALEAERKNHERP